MVKVKLRLPYTKETFNEKDLLEALEKIYYGYDSKFILPMCKDLVVAFIEELKKEIKENK